MANDVVINIKANSKDAERELGGFAQRVGAAFEQHRKTIGLAMTAVGAAITGVAVLSVKSAQEEIIGINRLNQALSLQGLAYADLMPEIEAVIDAQQRKTNFGDEAQRDALTSLISVTGDYQTSLAALPAVLDLAAARGMDLEAASTLVARALEGETGALTRYGIKVAEGGSQTEVITAIMAKFGGQAEAAADPVVQLKNRVGDMTQELGKSLIPLVNQAAIALERVASRVQAWATENPELAKTLTLITVGVGAILAVLGPLVLVLPQAAAGITMIGVAAKLATASLSTMHPAILALTLATTGLVAANFLLGDKLDGYWRDVANRVVETINKILKAYKTVLELFGQKVEVDFLEVLTEDEVKYKRALEQREAAAKAANEAEAMAKTITDRLSDSMKGVTASSQAVTGATATVGIGIQEAASKLNLYSQEMVFARDLMRDDFEGAIKSLTEAGLSQGDAWITASIAIKDKFIASLNEMAASSENGKSILQALEEGVISLEQAYDALEKSQTKIIEGLNEISLLRTNRAAVGATDESQELLFLERNFEVLSAAQHQRRKELLAKGVQLPKLAEGGDIIRQGMAIVGERGRELINLPRGASVRPLAGVQLPKLAEGGADVRPLRREAPVVNINISGNIYGLDDLNRKVAEAVRKTLQGGGFSGLKFGSA